MNHFYSHMLLVIIGSLLWLLIGGLIMRSKIGSGDVVVMLIHDVPWVGYAMFWFCLLLWPIYLLLVFGSQLWSAIRDIKPKRQKKPLELVIRPSEEVIRSIDDMMLLFNSKSYDELFGNALSFYHLIAKIRENGDEIYVHHAAGGQSKINFPD